jgi:hypothetical protein
MPVELAGKRQGGAMELQLEGFGLMLAFKRQLVASC